MRPLIVTFTHPEHAHDFVRSLRHRYARSVSKTNVGPRGEALDHELVAAWVEEVDEPDARQIAVETGGVVHCAAPEEPASMDVLDDGLGLRSRRRG